MKKKQNSPKALSLLGYLFCANSVRDFKGCVKTQKIIIWMGKVPLLLTTKRKVQIEIDLYATCYNLRHLFNVCPMSELLKKLDKYEIEAD